MLSIKGNAEQPEIQKSWSSGPSILATFYVERSSIIRINLALAKRFSCQIFGNNLQEKILEWMEHYSKKEKCQELPLDFTKLTPFTIKGLLAIQTITMGRQASYGKIAALTGKEKAARAIGNICNRNPFPLVIPCHRVVQRDGSIGGFAYPLEIKRLLLNFES